MVKVVLVADAVVRVVVAVTVFLVALWSQADIVVTHSALGVLYSIMLSFLVEDLCVKLNYLYVTFQTELHGQDTVVLEG